jgi:hypothetical protein
MSEEIVLTLKTVRLLDLSEAANVKTLEDLRNLLRKRSACPAICTVCGATGQARRVELFGYRDACGCRGS